MNDQLKEVLEFANTNPSSWFATCEDNQPSVRGMLMWFADETGFYFHTAEAKHIFTQLKKNPLVEVAFIRNQDDPVNFETLRVKGMVEIVKDEELEKRLFEERPWLWGNINRSSIDKGVAIFKIVAGTAFIWNMSYNVRESEAPRIAF